MSDQLDMRNVPGVDAVAKSVSSATKTFQTFASEVQKLAKDSVDNTTHTMEKLRGAKSIEDVVSIQTAFMQQSFSSYADYARKLSELMMALPMEFARHGRSAFQQGADAVSKVASEAGEQIRDASEQFTQHQG